MIADKDKNTDRNRYGRKPENRSSRRKLEDNENQPFHVKHQKEGKLQLVCGMRPVLEAIDTKRQIDKVFIQNNIEGSLASELRKAVADAGIAFQYVPVEKLNRMTSSNHQGVVAVISPIVYHDYMQTLQDLLDEEKKPVFLLLDHITDVRNLGAIVRTAECAGIDAVIVPDRGSAQINEDAIKCSSGALLRMKICREQNLKTVINLARQSGLQVCAATEKGATSYLNVDFRRPTLLIMGSEDTGISSELLKMSDVKACLPIMGEIQSLNVSVAAGIFMYEIVRQRQSDSEA
ncbi:MAG: 23S rRNA (guanosine(2251)-2'-O)-methyltransferase RlmB [Bacteroidales bacterium]|nr:23S rRNA (guanosine(2251)-2'-O)-methyltransferase RlmB [Bacteroidales bacterium]